jgi:hypothetical protein
MESLTEASRTPPTPKASEGEARSRNKIQEPRCQDAKEEPKYTQQKNLKKEYSKNTKSS